MVNEECIMKLGMLEQEASQLQQKLQIAEQHLQEMREIKSSMLEIENHENKEMLANLGKNIFIKTDVKDKSLFVDVGSKVLVKKSIPETVVMIEEQAEKLAHMKMRILERLDNLRQEMEKVVSEAEAENQKAEEKSD